MNDKNTTDMGSFLKGQENQGSLDSMGEFTLSRKKALLKLGRSQFQKDEDWVLKIVQAIVREGNSESIKVKLKRKSTNFHFQTKDWTLESIDAAFYDSEISKTTSLGHLTRGLRSVALRDKKNFTIQLSGFDSELVWNNTELQQRPLKRTAKETVLSVQLQGQDQASHSWLKRRLDSSRSNLDLNNVFRRQCYTCPIPLTVDGQITDSLRNCPRFGRSKNTFPLAIGFVEGDVPKLVIPSRTFEKTKYRSHPEKDNISFFSVGEPTMVARGGGGVKEKLADIAMSFLAPRKSASIAYLLSFTLKCSATQRPPAYFYIEEHSRIFWVLDGVIISSDLWSRFKTDCTVGCFLSAEGLETDLSTLSLVKSDEKNRRFLLAQRAVAEQLETDLRQLINTEAVEENSKRKSYGWGILLVASSVGLLSVNPLLGALGGMIGGAVYQGRVGGEKEELDSLLSDVCRSVKSLKSRIPDQM